MAFSNLLLSLAPAAINSSRLRAMRDLSPEGPLFLNKWFLALMISACVVATIGTAVLYYFRRQREKDKSRRSFIEDCHRYGLSRAEGQILREIANRANLRHESAVFTMPEAFERGAGTLMREAFASDLNVMQRRTLNLKIHTIKQKLDLGRSNRPLGIRNAHGKGLSSRRVPTGRKVMLFATGGQSREPVEATVIENSEHEMVLTLERETECEAGQEWNVQYRSGAAVWEFDVLTVYYDGKNLTVNHSDHVRFVSRRRFLNVRVDKSALVASFPPISQPFEKDRLGLVPRFVEARVTEMSGPSLRLESSLSVRPGERLLVVFELDERRIVEDVGEVRGIREEEGKVNFGVELVGLGDRAVDELVRTTNSAALGFGMDQDAKVHAEAFVEAKEKVHA